MDGLDKVEGLHIMCNWLLSGKSCELLVFNIRCAKNLYGIEHNVFLKLASSTWIYWC